MDYRPDWQPTTPGVLTYTENLVPDKAGNYLTSFTAEATGYEGTAVFSSGGTKGARIVKDDTGTARLIVGGATQIKEANGSGGWTDRSSGAYTLGTNDRWWFEQYGSETIACNGVDATEKSTTGAFSALTNAPKTKIMIAQSGHLLACNYNDGSASPSGIKWCSQNADTVWTPASGNSAGSATLRESPGEITAAAQLHDIVAVWKKRSMYVGRRVGGPDIWRFNLLSPYIGCWGLYAWAATPAGIVFFSENGVYLFDGSMPRPIDDGVRSKIYNDLNLTSAFLNIFMSHDEQLGTVYIWLLGATRVCYAYNYISDKWGVAYKKVSGSSSGELGSTTYTTPVMGVKDSNFVDMVALGVSAPASNLRTSHLIIDSANKMINLSSLSPGDSFRSRLITGLMRAKEAGPDDETELNRVVPLYATVAGSVRQVTTPTGNSVPYTTFSGGGGATAIVASHDTTKKRFDLRAAGNVVDWEMYWASEFGALADLSFNLRRAGNL